MAIASGVHMCSSPRTRHWYSPPGSSIVASTGALENADAMPADGLFHHLEADPPTLLGVPGEVLVDELPVQPDRFEDLGAAVGLYVEMPIFDMTLTTPLPIALM